YSVADAKATLPRLIDRAAAGEEVVITRHGKPVAEIRPVTAAGTAPSREARAAAVEWLRARRLKLDRPGPTSVELLNMIYDDPEP
ncbi:MAG: type II toxin-antitoxin system Phd/YefM family antitoxin, partial [Caulobacteraceae bacterium]